MTKVESRHDDHAYRAAVGRIAWFRGAFALVIDRSCSRHGVAGGVPCWGLGNGHRAVCGSRIGAAGLANSLDEKDPR